MPVVSPAARFLTALAEGADTFCFRTFPDRKANQTSGLTPRNYIGKLDEHRTALARANAAGAGVFVVVNGGGHTAAEIDKVRAVFVDLDGAALEPVLACALPPHMVVESSPGRYHAYWFCDGLPLEQFRPVQQSIAAQYGGDATVCDLPRVMRLPGTTWHKGSKPHVVRIIEDSCAQRYTAEQILAEFPPFLRAPKAPLSLQTGEVIATGDRHRVLVSTGAKLRNAGLGADAIEAALSVVNEKQCESPKPADEVKAIALWCAEREVHATPLSPLSRDQVIIPEKLHIDGQKIEGAKLLHEVHDYLGRFVAYPNTHSQIAHTLWLAHTHCMDAWDSTPRIAFLSPEPASGKSRALEVSELLVPRAVEAVNVTPAYLFRKVAAEEGRPTILYDEIDTVFGPKAKDNEEIRGLLNAGHRKHSVAGRCYMRGKQVVTEEIPAYCAVALAGLGGLPDTILTRSVIVRMRRRSPAEKIQPYRRRTNGPAGQRLGALLAAWVGSIASSVMGNFPELPSGIVDRDADVWEPLLAVADAAGGDWPSVARVAAVALVADSKQSTPSLGVQLLTDLKSVFGDAELLSTDSILTALHALDESPWSDIRGKSLDARGLSSRLKPYGISPRNVRIGTATPKGYRRQDLHDAWARYLPVSATNATSATSATNAANTANGPLRTGAPGEFRDNHIAIMRDIP